MNWHYHLDGGLVTRPRWILHMHIESYLIHNFQTLHQGHVPRSVQNNTKKPVGDAVSAATYVSLCICVYVFHPRALWWSKNQTRQQDQKQKQTVSNPTLPSCTTENRSCREQRIIHTVTHGLKIGYRPYINHTQVYKFVNHQKKVLPHVFCETSWYWVKW